MEMSGIADYRYLRITDLEYEKYKTIVTVDVVDDV